MVVMVIAASISSAATAISKYTLLSYMVAVVLISLLTLFLTIQTKIKINFITLLYKTTVLF